MPLGGNHYCGGCKSMALPAAAVAITRESDEAKNALKYAIIGMFCFGFILQPMAIAAALRARKEIALDPTIGGKGKATAALIIACVVLLFWVLGIMSGINKKPTP
ncbi:MAG TPA: hypothetical protein VFO83_05410 [Aggregicoccus sp.]|nr:hypothetical protein [Aggregicoccus sp.]